MNICYTYSPVLIRGPITLGPGINLDNTRIEIELTPDEVKELIEPGGEHWPDNGLLCGIEEALGDRIKEHRKKLDKEKENISHDNSNV